MNKFTIFLLVKFALPCFNQVPLRSTAIFALWIKVNFRVILLSKVSGDLMLSFDNYFDVHANILALPVSAIKDL